MGYFDSAIQDLDICFNKEDSWKYKGIDGLKSLRNHYKPIPGKHGVYIIRAPEAFSRLSGCSDILYIGSAGDATYKTKQGIGKSKGSVGRLFNTRKDYLLNLIHDFFGLDDFRVECYFTDQTEDPEEIESKLIEAYLKDHLELPPVNAKIPEIVTKK
jgi:hypothetical protein